MGYARLNFGTAVTTAQAMYDIVRVLDGTITSIANLSYASTTLSEIVNTLGENWTVAYGSVADTTTSYVLSKPCVTSSKTHWVRLQMFNGTSWDSSIAFSTAAAGVGLNSITAATSNTAVSNPAFYSTSSGATGGGRYVVKVDASNTSIFVHWSQHHILFYGLSGAGATTMMMGSFEYPENSLTQYTGEAPILQYNYTYNQATTFTTILVPGASTANTITFQSLNQFDPVTNTITGVYNLGVSGFGTVIHNDFSPTLTLTNTGANTYPLVPYYWNLPSLGLPFVNISDLTGVYRMSRGIANSEDLFAVGADNYVWLPLSTTITGGTQQAAIALLKK